jgi:O-antigen ligase
MTLGGGWRATSVVVVLLGAAIVFGTHSAAGKLGYGALAGALLVGWLLIALPQTPARLLAAVLFALAAAAAYVLVTLVPVPPYNCEALALPTWLIDTHRQIIWGFALDRAADAPWFGYGIDVGGNLPGASIPLPDCVGQNYLPSHAHNWMIELFVETGAFGLAGAVAALLLFARDLVQRAARGQTGALAGLALAGAFWGSGLVNFSIWAAWWQVSFLMLTAITLSPAAALEAAPREDAQDAR